jgi:MYXO-CTERM domain-containing protein
MKRFSWLSTVCALGLGCAALLGAAGASAQECESDADCSTGLECISYGEQEDCARPAIDCAEGEDCPEPAPCEAKEVKGCALPSCETDDDCPGGTVCHAAMYERCSGASGGAEPGAAPAEPCPDGEDCPQPEEPVCDTPECKEAIVPVDCETVTEDPVCVPVYQLPCSANADCGAGFTCKEQISTSCSGSGPRDGGGSDGDPGSSGDPLPPEEQPSCTSEPTGEFRCEAIVTECASSDDCEAGWTCAENPSRPVCDAASDQPAGDRDDSGAFAPPADGDTPEDDQPVDGDCGVESTEPEMVCLPPFHDVNVGRDARADGEATSSGTPGSDNDDGSEPPTDPQDGDGNEEGDGDEAAGMGESESDSCAVSAPGSGAGSSAMSLLGLIGLATLRRRRARKA